MAMVDLDSVYKVTAKGHTYYYAWRGKGAPRLHSAPGSAAFVQELADALASRKTGVTGRISGLCAMYRASDWRKDKVSDKTWASWSPWVDRVQEYFGALKIAQFDRPAIRPEIKRWRNQYRSTPRAADMGLQVLSHILSFAMDEGLLAINPVFGIERLYESNRAGIIWLEEDFAKLAEHAPPELMWAAYLAVFTGLRQADLLKMNWSHVKAHHIEISTGKSGERKTALIPLHGKLRDLLAVIPKRSTRILTNTEHVPWKTGFGSSWGKATTKAEIDKHFHDLRGTAATELYMADLTIREIAEIMTWSEEQVKAMIDRYVKRDEIMRERIRRMENEAATSGAKPPAKLLGT